jgi:hypothetical protein
MMPNLLLQLNFHHFVMIALEPSEMQLSVAAHWTAAVILSQMHCWLKERHGESLSYRYYCLHSLGWPGSPSPHILSYFLKHSPEVTPPATRRQSLQLMWPTLAPEQTGYDLHAPAPQTAVPNQLKYYPCTYKHKRKFMCIYLLTYLLTLLTHSLHGAGHYLKS